VEIGYDATGLRSSAGPTFYAGDLFEYQRTSDVGTAHIFALGRRIAFKKIPAVTLRTDGPFGETPFENLPQFLVLALLTATGALVFVLFLRSGATGAWLQRPASVSALFLLVGLVALPPNTWAAAFPPAPSGVYRRWISSDLNQSGVYVHDEEGRRAHKRIFEPFGAIFAEVNSESTPRQFAMHPYDASLGLYYMKARFYDPSVGRFTALDPLIRDSETVESVNPYSYVENNPVNRVDPYGREGTSFQPGSSSAPFGYEYSAGQVNVIGNPGATVYGAFVIQGNVATPVASFDFGSLALGNSGFNLGNFAASSSSSATSTSSGTGFLKTLGDIATLPLGLAVGVLAIPFNILGGLVPEIKGFDIGVAGNKLTQLSLALTPSLSNAAAVFALNTTLGIVQSAVGLGYLALTGLAYVATAGRFNSVLPDIEIGFDRGGITISGGLQSVFTPSGYETGISFGALRFFSSTSAVGTLGSHESGHSVRSALQGPLYIPLVVTSYFEQAAFSNIPLENDATKVGLP
jgi:RHS repeat-associated protein